jgi:hypothetical protein
LLTKNENCIIANGDLRLSANQKCWPEQAKMEESLGGAASGRVEGGARPSYDKAKKHGFIDSQKMGLEVFRARPKAPLIVAESVWQYSQHVLPGCSRPAARS